jgi:hypothetical protein
MVSQNSRGGDDELSRTALMMWGRAQKEKGWSTHRPKEGPPRLVEDARLNMYISFGRTRSGLLFAGARFHLLASAAWCRKLSAPSTWRCYLEAWSRMAPCTQHSISSPFQTTKLILSTLIVSIQVVHHIDWFCHLCDLTSTVFSYLRLRQKW